MAAETTKKLEVQDYAEEKKAAEGPSDFVLLKRIERDVAQLSDAGLAYLRTKLALVLKEG